VDGASGGGILAEGKHMALRVSGRALLLLVTLMVLITPNVTYSCGPFLFSAIFVYKNRPDGRDEDFAAGKLGILRPEFRQSYLVIAYRYLSGLTLEPEQREAAEDVWSRNVVPEHPELEAAIAAWRKARNAAAGLPAAPEVSPYAPVSLDQPYFEYLNCPGDAFQNAARTLEDRASKFGIASANVHEWISGQDAVFANCGGKARMVPAALDSGDELLRADRAYQIAAAHFYARDFDEAAADFEAIAKDRSSPWQDVGLYLAARALIRKASLVPPGNQPPFDRTTMLEAQRRLEAIAAESGPGAKHDAALRLLNYIRFRTEPLKRVAELDHMILQPNPGESFKQDLWDYVVLLSHGEQSGDPSTWVQTFQAAGANLRGVVREQTVKKVMSNWQETKSLPWLITALAASDANNPELQSLLTAAGEIPRSSPGYLTVRSYALRLMASSGQSDAARKELDTLLSGSSSGIPLGSRNLLNEERLELTTSLNDFLQHAPEMPVPAEVDFNTGEEVMSQSAETRTAEPLFNRSAAETLTKRLSVADLIRAAESPLLPQQLRREVARSTWVRAVLLNDLNSAESLQSALHDLDPPLWKMMQPFRSTSDFAEKHFAAVFVILSNPGLKPSVREGSLRTATLGEIDNYRDNWWCADIGAGSSWSQNYSDYSKDFNQTFVDRDPDFPFPVWITGAGQTAVRSEWANLTAVGTAPNYLVNQVLAYAKQRPQDPQVPEALHLSVRSTRFGCTNAETSGLSKAAFQFLHEHYPQNEWTSKTKFYY